MPFKETQEGSTHHDKDNCYKCKECGSHFNDVYELYQHKLEIIQCSSIKETHSNNKK